MAFGASTVSDLGGAVSDLFAAKSYDYKIKGAQFEKQNYDEAAVLADQNAQFTEASTAIKQAQLERSTYQTIGGQQSDVAGAGFAASGSALDLLRDSAAQGALTKAVAGEQGLITEAGYREQADSYRNLSQAASVEMEADKEAQTGAYISSAFKTAASIATLFV